MQFSELNLSAGVLRAIDEMGFTDATEIQSSAIPVIKEGKDIIGRSNTGTGKTAAFGIPAVESIVKGENNGVEVLILCPTRELAMQACDEIRKFSKYLPWVKPCAVFGGANMDKQIFELKRGANIVVGTPGRVMDHMDRKTLKLENLKMIILDEADEMLNMGFREDIEKILGVVPEERQTILFSATMPPAILAITKQYQNDPVIIKVDAKARTVDSIEQYYYEVPMGRKNDALQMLLLAYEPKLSMIFCNTKKMVDELTELLVSKGFKAAGLHGDMKQASRTQVLNAFKSGRINILIATDVAARGIDVDNIDAVFNYDLPQDNEYYIHRIGRTGRAGKSGAAYSLISGRRQVFELKDIARFTKAEITRRPLPAREDVISSKSKHAFEKIKTCVESGKYEQYTKQLNELIEQGFSVENIAVALLGMRLSKDTKNIPEFIKPVPLDNGGQSSRNGQNGTPRGKVNTVKVEISVGRANRIAPNFILSALVDATGLTGKNFGKIDIYDKYSTVEVPEKEKEHVLESMTGTKINGSRINIKLHEYKGDRQDKGGKSDRGGRGYAKKYSESRSKTPNRRKRFQ